ncbi:MAG: hypothetical protein MJ074_06805 [Oscillospiraceae bacterium]|nr:hypothetical protein [Oscillospiraceae bacterium]
MKRAEKKNYRGKKPRAGFTAEQAVIFAALVLAAVIALTISVNAKWTGKSAGAQLYEAVFVAKDWD